MVIGDDFIGYLFLWMIQKFAEAEKNAEKVFKEMRSKIWIMQKFVEAEKIAKEEFQEMRSKL